MNYKKTIVEKLKGSEQPVSGQDICKDLGISRVAVWKHIQSLNSVGYTIESTSRGYILKGLPDTLDEWSFPGLQLPFYHVEECGSTMEYARSLYFSGSEPYVVAADSQSEGKADKSGIWYSPPGGIYTTLVIPALVPWEKSGLYYLMGTLGICFVLKEIYHLDSWVRWPNEVFIGSMKISGMLGELYGPFHSPEAAALGIGINVNRSESNIPVSAVALSELMGERISRRDVLEILIKKIIDLVENFSPKNIIREWKQYFPLINTMAETSEGPVLILDINDWGALIVQKGNGEAVRLPVGAEIRFENQ